MKERLMEGFEYFFENKFHIKCENYFIWYLNAYLDNQCNQDLSTMPNTQVWGGLDLTEQISITFS
jgi:hypothetical protein